MSDISRVFEFSRPLFTFPFGKAIHRVLAVYGRKEVDSPQYANDGTP